MKSIKDKNQAGVVLVVVLVLLTLFAIVGLTFTFYASQTACSQNPTIETRDGKCTKVVGSNRH
jgi:flagellar basal body-associated protein FliL